jgi:hypothetical protein
VILLFSESNLLLRYLNLNGNLRRVKMIGMKSDTAIFASEELEISLSPSLRGAFPPN